jgi:predicted nucleotidyltransferase
MTPTELLQMMASRLQPLLEEVVFLGGCATQLLITDPAAPPLRITDDVDVIVEIGSLLEYSKFSKRLRNLGFVEDSSEGAPICRFRVDGMKLDVMPTDESILGFSNRWYSDAFSKAETLKFYGLNLRVVTAPHFLATKLEAFKGRGAGDFSASKDLEDIISVIDGRPTLLEEVSNANARLLGYIRREFGKLLENREFVEAVPGHLLGDPASQARAPRILKILKELASRGPALHPKKGASKQSKNKSR